MKYKAIKAIHENMKADKTKQDNGRHDREVKKGEINTIKNKKRQDKKNNKGYDKTG